MAHPDFADMLARYKTLLETALEARLPDAGDEPKAVHAAMRHAVLGGGKRIRPLLTIGVADLIGHPPESVLDTACAVEFIHAASLILDDLPAMDNAKERRGLPCTHVEFGESTALLATVGLISLAYDLIAHNADDLETGRTSRAVRAVSQAIGSRGIIHGQSADLNRAGKRAELPPEAWVQHKAAALFLLAVTVPAQLLGLDPGEQRAVETFAGKLGQAFQMADDIDDAAAGAEDRGKTTYASELGGAGARAGAAALLDEAAQALDPFGPRAARLRALIDYVQARLGA